MAKIPWKSHYFPVFPFLKKNSPIWEIPPKTKRLGKSVRAGMFFFFFWIFFGARGVGGEGSGSELLGGWGCCQVVFSSFFSFFFFFVLRSSYKSLHEALVCGSRQQQPSRLLFFSFWQNARRVIVSCPRIGRADDDLSFFWFCFGVFYPCSL
jgi:hypothetical protein